MCIDADQLKEFAPLGVDILGGANDYFSGQNTANRVEAAATRAAIDENRQLHERNIQSIDQAGEDVRQRAHEARVAKARLRLASSESGVGGVSVARLITGEDAAEGQDTAAINRNVSNKLKQAAAERKSTESRRRNRASEITRPSLLGIGLQIGQKEANRRSEKPDKKKSTKDKGKK